MNLIKTSILTSISTIIKILSSFVTAKVVATQIGPSGMAILGQFNNFVGIVSSIACSINTGVIKYVAEFYDNELIKKKIISNGLKINIIISLFLTVLVILFSTKLSISLLKVSDYSSIFFIFGLSLILFSLNNFFLSLINGFKDIKKYVLIGILSNILGLVLTIFLVYCYGIYGVLLSIVISQSTIFIISLIFVINSKWFRKDIFTEKIDIKILILFLKYSLMAIVSGILIPLSQMVVRNFIINDISTDAAGYWQAINQLSGIYLNVVTTSLGIYYLPKLSELNTKDELRKEIFNGYKILLPIVAFLSFMIYLLRYFIIQLLLSDKFLPMAELFGIQFLGDFIKISSWLLAYIMVAKAMTKMYLFTEVVFVLNFIILSIIFINYFGLIGSTYAYLINYCLYLISMLILFRKLLFI